MTSDHRIQQMGMPHTAAMRAFVLVVGPFVLLITAGCGGGGAIANGGGRDPVAATVSGTIAVGTAPRAVAVDSIKNKIYVTDFGVVTPVGGFTCSPSGADVRIIDGATQSTTSISFTFFVPPASWNPYAVAVNSSNGALYVGASLFGPNFNAQCGFDYDGVELFDTTTLAQTKNIGTVVSVGGIDLNLASGNIYVTNYAYYYVAVLDNSGSAVPVATIPVGTSPVGIAVNATTNKIYVANSGSNDISVIDGASNSVMATITDPKAVVPVAVAVNSTTNTIYVANEGSNSLTIIDGATNTVTATVPVGVSPSGVAVNSQTNFIYVANEGNSQAGDPGTVTVIDGATNTPQTLTDPNAKNPDAVAVDSVTNKIYVANSGSNNVTVMNGAHN